MMQPRPRAGVLFDMKALVLMLLVACSPAQRTHGLAASSTLVLAADYLQTRVITDGCTEDNPFLGKCGERANVTAYFATAIAINLAVGYLLPRKAGYAWLGSVSVFEGAVVGDNYFRFGTGFR